MFVTYRSVKRKLNYTEQFVPRYTVYDTHLDMLRPFNMDSRTEDDPCAIIKFLSRPSKELQLRYLAAFTGHSIEMISGCSILANAANFPIIALLIGSLVVCCFLTDCMAQAIHQLKIIFDFFKFSIFFQNIELEIEIVFNRMF